jgi:aldehyde dehydrogenase (NAD+)
MKQLIESQKTFFNNCTTLDTGFRIQKLKQLKKLLKENEDELYHAVYADFKKSSYETYISELGQIYREINKACKQVRKWSRKKKVKTDIMNFPAGSYLVPVPLGVVLIIGSWNFPYMLSLIPAVSALAAGNTVVLKPSELPEQSSHVLARLINENFEPDYFRVVEGGVPETTELLDQKFDKIFFTGSTKVGKIVYQAAAKNLIPVTLEMGGKNPVIFTEHCELKKSVKRLIWAKFLNAGQTCIAPDYILVHQSVKDEFLRLAVAEIQKSHFSFGNQNYVQTISKEHAERLIRLIEKDKIFYGGSYDAESRYVEPTILHNIGFEDAIMQEEIFGPVLPVIGYTDLNEVISKIRSLPSPLSFYVFTKNKQIKHKLLREVPFGGGAVNDSVMHFINMNLPFGGVGNSGTGSYHGEYGFKTFTHYKGILDKPTWFEPPIKYFPHTKFKLKLIKRLIE